MRRLILELRRREVFRTAGLYVGICWIAIEASSVLLPAFEAPDWMLRALIIAAFVGFPVTIVLSWFYDVTDEGVEIQADPTDTAVAPLGSRKTDFVVIGVLSVALVFSLYLNLAGGPEEAAELAPVSLLIADFDNRTGNALFDGSVEQALSLGVEGASFITAYPRDRALDEARELGLGDRLDADTARLVAVRQDVRMVLAGSIEPDDGRFELTLRAFLPAGGEPITDARATAAGAAEVLGAVNELAAEIRAALGDESGDLEQLQAGETVTAASIEAMKFYTTAQDLARDGQDERAIEFYARAIEEDPNMARAWSGWGLSAHKLGRPVEAEEKWNTALSLLDRMTERERYRTLGLYYTVVSVDYEQAIATYEQLVAKFPADGAGNNNLAVLYTITGRYDRALEQSRQLLEIYPGRTLYHANHAQYALYAGDFETARREAGSVIEQEPDFFKSYMILALTALDEGDVAGALRYYERMAETGARGASLANVGMADIALYERRFDDAIAILNDGIAMDEAGNNPRGRGTKLVALAQAYAGKGEPASALAALERLDALRGDGMTIPAAELYAATGDYGRAFEIAEGYRDKLGPTARAYGHLIDGLNAYHQGEYVMAIESLRQAIGYVDLWIIRYWLGKAYVGASYGAAALQEFDACIARRGEAGGLFFDDVPTWRYTAGLNDWKKKADDVLDAIRTASAE